MTSVFSQKRVELNQRITDAFEVASVAAEPGQTPMVDVFEVLESTNNELFTYFRTVYWEPGVEVGSTPSHDWFPLMWAVYLMQIERAVLTDRSMLMLLDLTTEGNDGAIFANPQMATSIARYSEGNKVFLKAVGARALEGKHISMVSLGNPPAPGAPGEGSTSATYFNLLMQQLYRSHSNESRPAAAPRSEYRDLVKHMVIMIASAVPEALVNSHDTRLYDLLNGITQLLSTRADSPLTNESRPFTKASESQFLTRLTFFAVQARSAAIDLATRGGNPEDIPYFDSRQDAASMLMIAVTLHNIELLRNVASLLTKTQWVEEGRDGRTIFDIIDMVEYGVGGNAQFAQKARQMMVTLIQPRYVPK